MTYGTLLIHLGAAVAPRQVTRSPKTPNSRWPSWFIGSALFHKTIGVSLLVALVSAAAHGDDESNKSQPAPSIVEQAYRMRMDGKLDEAKETLERELSQHPKNAPAWLELARLEFQRSGKTRELDSAQQAVEKAIEAAPDRALYYRWAGHIATFNAILKSKNRADLVEQMGKATQALEEAVKLDEDDHAARMLLVSLYGNNPPELGGDPERAERHVKALETRSPVDGVRARCEFSMKGEPEKKLAAWKALAKARDKDARVHAFLAREYAWNDDVENARLHADTAIEIDSSQRQVLIDVARAFALKMKPDLAKPFAQRYLSLDPAGPLSHRAWAHMALGQIQRMQGDKEAATKSIEKAKELDPYCWFTMTPPPNELFAAP